MASTDGGDWLVETVDLDMTSRGRSRWRGERPLGDSGQLLVRRNGHHVAWVAKVEDLDALGVDRAKLTVVARW